MKRSFYAIAVGLTVALAACQSGPEPAPTETPTVEVVTEATSAPTFTPTSPPTWTPTPQSSPAPTEPPAPAATSTPVPNDVWVDAANGLNLRAEAKSDAQLITTLKNAQHLVAIDSPVGPDANGITWQNVRTDDGQTGWVSAQFLTKTNPAGPTPAPTQAPTAAATPVAASGEVWVIATDGLNLRAQATTTGTLVATLPLGTHLSLTGAPAGPDAAGITWQSVRTDDSKTGFVAAQFISTTKPVTTTTPTPTAAAPVTTTTSTPTATAPTTTTTTLGDVWVIATGGLNLRAQPGTSAGVVATLTYGQRLTALAPKSTPDAAGIAWQNVRTEASQSGWAAADYLSTTPPISATATPTSTAGTAGTSVTNLANEVVRRVNELRAQNGLNTVTPQNQLLAAALRHSQDMAKTGKVDHTGSDGSTAQQRITAAGYVGQAKDEVIYGGRVTIDDVWYFWTTDRLHANVLLNPRYTDIGVAVVNVGDRYYYTAVFGGPSY
jgi:uncharacterized protein YkwD